MRSLVKVYCSNGFALTCIYLKYFAIPEESADNQNSEDEEESVTEMSEVRFIPQDRGLLDAMYHAMTVCQTLHPDPNDSVSDGICPNTIF